MKNSINKLLLPVRVVTKQVMDHRTPTLVSYIVCNNGEMLTDNIPFDWAQFISTTLNARYYKKSCVTSNPIAIMRIPGHPMEKTESQRITGTLGSFKIIDNPDYFASFERIAEMGEQVFYNRWTQLPIQVPVEITALYRVHTAKRYSLPLVNAWLLDLLKSMSIIESITDLSVKSMDGSRIIHGQKPEIIVTFREWRRGSE